MRIGNGYDVHRLVENRKLILGGVEIPYEKGLLGHSDADVLLHAVMDALLGAAALGDIGKHFPDTDPAYEGASSIKLLEEVGKLIDGQMGLSMASTYDPNTQSQATLMENLIYFVGLVVFFSIDAHHIVINSMQNSFKIIPVGYSIIDYNFTYILSIFTQYFIMGLKMAMPLIVVLIVTDIITGIISRSISGLNVMIIGAPLKILVGIIFLLIALPFILNGMKDMIKHLKDVIEGTLVYQQNMIMVLVNNLF